MCAPYIFPNVDRFCCSLFNAARPAYTNNSTASKSARVFDFQLTHMGLNQGYLQVLFYAETINEKGHILKRSFCSHTYTFSITTSYASKRLFCCAAFVVAVPFRISPESVPSASIESATQSGAIHHFQRLTRSSPQLPCRVKRESEGIPTFRKWC